MKVIHKPTALICAACGCEMGFGFDSGTSRFDYTRIRCVTGGCEHYHIDVDMPSFECAPWVSPADKRRKELEAAQAAAKPATVLTNPRKKPRK